MSQVVEKGLTSLCMYPQVQRAVIWDAERREHRWTKSHLIGKDRILIEYTLPRGIVGRFQICYLGGEQRHHPKAGDMFKVSRHLPRLWRALEAREALPEDEDRQLISVVEKLRQRLVQPEDTAALHEVVLVTVPVEVYAVIVCPTPLLAAMGWTEPLYLHKVENPREELDPQAPPVSCFSSMDLEWRLNLAAVRRWDQVLDSTVEVMTYVSWKLADVSVA